MKNDPTTPGAFLRKLRKDADSFADGLSISALVAMAGLVFWGFAAACGIAPPIPAAVLHAVMWLLLGYLVFRALAALIDYAIYATVRALLDVIGVTAQAVADQFGDRETPSA
jgi:hypothetical protein